MISSSLCRHGRMKTSIFLYVQAWRGHGGRCWEPPSTFASQCGDHLMVTRTRGMRTDSRCLYPPRWSTTTLNNGSRLIATEFDPGDQQIGDSDGQIVADRTYVLRFDGGSRGNPGIAGAGMVLYDSETRAEVWCGMKFLGDGFTNNQAEFCGLVTGVKCALALGVRHIVVQGDSQLILRQISGEYKVKSPSLKSYYTEAMRVIEGFDTFQTNHILRARNSRADELANLAMDHRTSTGFEVSDAPS